MHILYIFGVRYMISYNHDDMGMDNNETGNAGTKGETRGTGMNGGVSEMQWN